MSIVFRGNVLFEVMNPEGVLEIIDETHLCVIGYPSVKLIEGRPQVVKLLGAVIRGQLSTDILTSMYDCKVHAVVKELSSTEIEITLTDPKYFGLGIFRRFWISNAFTLDVPIFNYIWKIFKANPDESLMVLAVYWRPWRNVFRLN